MCASDLQLLAEIGTLNKVLNEQIFVDYILDDLVGF